MPKETKTATDEKKPQIQPSTRYTDDINPACIHIAIAANPQQFKLFAAFNNRLNIYLPHSQGENLKQTLNKAAEQIRSSSSLAATPPPSLKRGT